jgi:hypothetical protein
MRTRTLVAVALCLSLLSACSSGSSKPTATAAGQSAATSASGAATVVATSAAGGKAADICAKIPLADAQALTPQPLQPSTNTGIGECLFHNAGQDLKVDYYLDDTDQQYYTSLSGSNDHPLAGVGDEAYWNEPIPGQSPPALFAHQGDETCTILSNDPPDTTLKYSGSEPFIKVTDADALAYVQLMAKVCEDVFAAR